ncbi:MAG: hypothetical protein ACK4PR_13280, partial [Gammaproteobacteria bacterium]
MAVNETLYFWPLNRAAVSIAYPRRPIDLSTTFLAKTTFEDKIDSNDLEINFIENRKNVATTQYTWNIYHKTLQKTQQLSYKSYKLNSRDPKLAISLDQTYFVIQCNEDLESTQSIQMLGTAGSIINKLATDRSIRIWDIKQSRLHWTITHPLPWAIIMFSRDSEWLVHGCLDVFIHRLKDKKRLLKLRIGNMITALALAADKSWLAVADVKGSLLVYDIQTQQLVYRLRNLPIIIRDLDITLDAQYLVAKGSKKGTLTFKVWHEASGVQIKGSMKNRVGAQDDRTWYEDDDINFLLKYYIGSNQTIELLDAMLGTSSENGRNILIENLIQFNSLRNQRLNEGKIVKNKFIIPVNLNNNHWTLFYLIYPENSADLSRINYFDPLGNVLPADLGVALQTLNHSLGTNIISIPGRVQNDGYNCGPWVVEAACSLVKSG